MTTLEYILPQLPSLAPMLLIYLAGAILCLLHLKRLGTPAALALVACAMLFLNHAVFPFVQGYIVTQQMGLTRTGLWMGSIGICRMVLQATAFALLLGAVFVGRTEAARPGYDMDDVPGADFLKGDPGRRSSA